MRAVAKLLTTAIGSLDDDGMPTRDLGWVLYNAGNIGGTRQETGVSDTERIIRLGGAFIAWADGHYLRIDQQKRDAWLVAGISEIRAMPLSEPGIDKELCELGATLLTHVLNDRAKSIMNSVDQDLAIATVIEGQAESHAALALALRVLMQVSHRTDQRIALAEGLNLTEQIYEMMIE